MRGAAVVAARAATIIHYQMFVAAGAAAAHLSILVVVMQPIAAGAFTGGAAAPAGGTAKAAVPAGTFADSQHARIAISLDGYLSGAANFVASIQPLVELEVINVSFTEQIAAGLYSQVLNLQMSNSSGWSKSGADMLYAGMKDGRFVGYYHHAKMVLRAKGDSLFSDLLWHPYNSATDINAACLSSPDLECAEDAPRQVASSCPVGSPSDGHSLPCFVVSQNESCCNSSIEVVYETSRDNKGKPLAAKGWALYDPRIRPWYKQEQARWDQNQTREEQAKRVAWSSIYPFSSAAGGALGISVTGPVVVGAEFLGVLSGDFQLGRIADLLQQQISNSSGQKSWAYIVERNAAVLEDRGKIVASARAGGASSPAMLWERATESSDNSISRSAALLESTNWSSAARLGNYTAQNGFEARSVFYSGTRFGTLNLDWVIVVGADIECETSTEIWVSLKGACEQCAAGSHPNSMQTSNGETGRQCVQCPNAHAGADGSCAKCTDGKQPNSDRTACLPCPTDWAGTDGTCHPCHGKDTGLVASQDHTTCSCPAGTYDSMKPVWPVQDSSQYDLHPINDSAALSNTAFAVARIFCWSRNNLGSNQYEKDNDVLNAASQGDLKRQQAWLGPSVNTGQQRCISCPACVDCSEANNSFGAQAVLTIKAGFSVPSSLHLQSLTMEDDLDIYRCSSASPCQNQSAGCSAMLVSDLSLKTQHCIDNHAGLLCGGCLKGYVPAGNGECNPCNEWSAKPVMFVVVLAICITIAMFMGHCKSVKLAIKIVEHSWPRIRQSINIWYPLACYASCSHYIRTCNVQLYCSV